MSALADRPDDDDDESNSNNKVDLPILNDTAKSTLPLEKLLTHRVFLDQIKGIDIDTAIELLGELHLLYLASQDFLVKWAKQDLVNNINNTK